VVASRKPAPPRGTLKEATFFSAALGIEKRYFIYLPPRYAAGGGQRFPAVYLFRGHEREWINREQDPSRTLNACEVADELIAQGAITDTILVMPSTTSEDGAIVASAVNIRSPELLEGRPGVGTGRFGDYLPELIAHVDATYRTRAERRGRAVDGFSVGGHTALLLAVKHPELFCSVATYDGSFGFWRKLDPRKGSRPQTDAIFDPFPYMYGRPFDIKHYRLNNPADVIISARGAQLRNIRSLRFFLHSAAQEPMANRDRGLHILSLLALKGIQNGPTQLVLDPKSEHTWRWADEHLRRSLVAHAQAFARARALDEAA
jgi:hypothetical protein